MKCETQDQSHEGIQEHISFPIKSPSFKTSVDFINEFPLEIMKHFLLSILNSFARFVFHYHISVSKDLLK